MAYTPDEAYSDIEEVGHKAFLLFAFYCKHGSMSNNRVKVSLEAAADWLGITYENACRWNAVLKKKGWIVLDLGETVLLKGWVKTDENISFKSRKNRQKLTKTAVLEVSKTDENSSFDDLPMSKTDENNSFEQIEECQKLTKTAVSPLEPPKGNIKYKPAVVVGSQPAAASNSPPKKTTQEKLDELQAKYPHLDVRHVREKYLKFCREKNKQPKWQIFEEKWLETEFEPMEQISIGGLDDDEVDKIIARKYGT